MSTDRRHLKPALAFVETIADPYLDFDERGPILALRGQALQNWANERAEYLAFRARSEVARAVIKLVDDDNAGERKFVAHIDPYSEGGADQAFDAVLWVLHSMIETPGARRFHDLMSASE
jgi:hypothetical protein